MSVPDKSIDPRLLSAAKAEFLEKGYELSSLSQICKRAGVTTGALYKRYQGKEALFDAIVGDTARELFDIASSKRAPDLTALSDEELLSAWQMSEEATLWWFEVLYARKDEFTLLVKYSAGTRYANFPHDWADWMNEMDYDYYLEAKRRGMAKKEVSREEMHILTSSFWALYYEPFIHDFSRAQIEQHAKILCGFINWQEALGITLH